MTDPAMKETSREEFLALTPARYLANGFVDQGGKPRPELQNLWATAAAPQLLAADLAPQELGLMYEALRQTLKLHAEGPAPQRLRAALDEALEIVRGYIGQPNNPGLVKWLNECAAMVKTPADLDAFMLHLL